ncbi:MAG: hypothetical protein VW475_14650, partial [Curvibacter sp.]
MKRQELVLGQALCPALLGRGRVQPGAALRSLRIIQRAQKVSLFEATRRALETDELKGRQRKSLGDLIRNFERWRAML